MFRRQNTALLPQISARSTPLCLLFSCPGDRILHFCHRFQPGASPCACFSHVPEIKYCTSATDFSQERPLVPAFLMSRCLYTAFLPQKSHAPENPQGFPKPWLLSFTISARPGRIKFPLLNIPNLTSAINFLYQASAINLPPIIPSQAQDIPPRKSQR